MKTLFLIIALLILVSGCVTPCDKCPPENVVIQSPHTGYPIMIEEGFFDDMEGIFTEEEFKKLQQELMKQYEGDTSI